MSEHFSILPQSHGCKKHDSRHSDHDKRIRVLSLPQKEKEEKYKEKEEQDCHYD